MEQKDATKVEVEVLPKAENAALQRVQPTYFEVAGLGAQSGLQQIEQFSEIMKAIRRHMLAQTIPQNWTIMGTGDAQFAYLTESGADVLALFVGANLRYSPVDHVTGNAAPIRFDVPNKDGVFGYRITCYASSSRLERFDVEAFAERRSDEEFTGRKDAPKGARGDDYNNAQALDGDLRSATLRLAKKKAIGELTGLKKVALSELETAWHGSNKKIGGIQAGAGHGSAAQRNVERGSDPDLKVEQQALWSILLKQFGGDEGTAGKFCQDFSAWEKNGKKGSFKTPMLMGFSWQIQQFLKRWREHPEEGKFAPTDADFAAEIAAIKGGQAPAGGAK